MGLPSNLPNARSSDEISRARELLVRAPENPILTPDAMPVACKAVCNPGAHIVDGKVLLLLRVIDEQNHSQLFVARSDNGITDWTIEAEPLLSPFTDHAWYDDWGCEDPRITYLDDLQLYAIVYVGWSRYGAGVCLATTRDFKTAERRGLLIHPYNKDAALFPRRIGGKYQMLHRPTSGPLENIWISESDDLVHWGNPRCVLEENDQPGWDSGKVGTGPPPIETDDGWVLLFHGVQHVHGGWLYRFGLALLDRNDPSRLIGRWPDWVFGPTMPYERNGNKPGIVFPTGAVVKDGQVMVYYGAADTTVALATGHLHPLAAFQRESAEQRKLVASHRPPPTEAEREHGAPGPAQPAGTVQNEP
jgi:predicted GH43/DUF377 family glycosyl hydrolase